jgi:DNA-binding response OmpR family regulator
VAWHFKDTRPVMTSPLSKPVLVVDGDRHMRTLIASIVKNSGVAEVAPAASLEDAQREIRINTPSAIITEFLLPDRDGLALIEWLRRAPDSPAPEIPALVLTGLTLPDVVVRARNVGAHAIIAKPVSARTLLTKIDFAVNDPRPFVRSVSYIGPCRRVRIIESADRSRRLSDDDDPLFVDDEHFAALAVHVDAVAGSARRLDPKDRVQIRAVRDTARTVGEQARAAADSPLVDAALSLVGYIDACGLSGRLDREVVDVHIGAMINLTSPERRREHRDNDVIAGLHKVVARRLGAAAA